MKTDAYRQSEEQCSLARKPCEEPDEIRAAWQHAERAMELDPDNASAAVLAGDLLLLDFDQILREEYSERRAGESALPYYERALEVEPLHADAWSGKAHALCRMERYEEALAAVEAGLAALPHGVDYLWDPNVYPYVDRELRKARVMALLGLGRCEAARRELEEAPALYPEHYYLVELRAEVGEG